VLLAKTFTSSTFKLALIAILAFGVIVAAIFAYVYTSTSSYVRSRSDRAILSEFASLQGTYDRAGRDGLVALIRERVTDRSFVDNVYLLTDPAGAVLAGNTGLPPLGGSDARGWQEFRAEAPMAGSSRGPPLVRAMVEKLSNGDRLLVGRDISELDKFTDQIRLALGLGLALIFVLAAVATTLVTRRTVGRIEEINATSRDIMQSGLDKRIPLRGSQDEWDRVAENLNLMLDRIETLMGEIKQVSDNVAHDLRTPLTRMRGRLEQAIHRERSAANDQALIGDTIADLDAVLRIFASLTRIAHIESGARKSGFRNVNLAEIAGEVVELYDAAAEQDGTRLTMTGEAELPVTGDRDLIFDAIANLVDNAIKHGRVGGCIAVATERAGGEAVITIADDGPGIPADQRDHVFKRFYRLEQGRCAPGNGLGLSLVAAVARLHGARIDMVDNAPGLKVRLWFPASPAEQGLAN
jgi:signal transduction histidine kinase